jgi:hypothetical protein
MAKTMSSGEELRTRARTLHDHASIIRDQINIVNGEIKSLTDTVASLEWMGQRKDRFSRMWDDTAHKMAGWAHSAGLAADELDREAEGLKAQAAEVEAQALAQIKSTTGTADSQVEEVNG